MLKLYLPFSKASKHNRVEESFSVCGLYIIVHIVHNSPMDLLSLWCLLYLSLAAGSCAVNVHTFFVTELNLFHQTITWFSHLFWHMLPIYFLVSPHLVLPHLTHIFPEISFVFQFSLFNYPHNITSQVNTIYLLANFPQITSPFFLFVLRRSIPLASNFRSSFWLMY